MFFITLENFRCFQRIRDVEIRPITFLVGENSAGKTSFLAALRFLIEAFTRSPQSPFNKEPYLLGGYDQIANYRGGRGGRAKHFSLSLSIPAAEGEQTSFLTKRRIRHESQHLFRFVKGSPQPELERYDFSTSAAHASLQLDKEDPKFTISSINGGRLSIDPKRLPPQQLMRRDLSYLRYVLDETYIQSKKEIPDNTQDVNLELDRFVQRFRQSSREVSRRAFASAPVRTEPLRTYTPSDILASSEGSHVPLEMARQKLQAPVEWENIRSQLVRFGQNSGLFDDIDIRMLGKRDGDPFQIMIKTKGPAVNLMDVGYGVSQSLPIVYQLQQSRNFDTFLLQQPEVHLHPRAQAELGTLIAELVESRRSRLYVVETHSDYIIDRVRSKIMQGLLDPRLVTIVFFWRDGHDVNARNLYVDDEGNVRNAPEGYRAFFLQEHRRMFGL